MSTLGFADLLRQRGFMRFWLARIASVMGSQMLMVAIGWQMYELTGSAWDLGLVGLLQFAPALVLTLPGGHLADRLPRARITAACIALSTGVVVVLGAATWRGWANRELLLAMSVLLGAVRAFQMPAQQALLPLLVPRLLLARATAFGSAGLQAAVIAGPALGGLLFVGGTEAVYAVCATLFCVAFALMLGLRIAHAPPPHEPASMRVLLAGVRFIWQRKALLGAVSLDLFAVLLGGAVALLPIFARDILHVGAWGLGLLRSAPAVGALAMSVALTRWPMERRVGHKLLAAVAVFGVATIVFGLSPWFWLSLVALAVSGAADMVSVVVRQTLVQLETPDAMRGRVAAVNSIFIGGSNQLGEFESGATAQWWGPRVAVVVGGIGTIVVAAAWFRLFPSLAGRDRMLPPPALPVEEEKVL
ncbi:MFS transporter [uncultured Ramlibacter sp.]|uniref:MFS transporter n=1 Tax=uncultured Ramlibacter sp. TaxID=260755 RepID=UPI00262290F8|nr:MFS transporter [uncultured Ramlibacter sp.]